MPKWQRRPAGDASPEITVATILTSRQVLLEDSDDVVQHLTIAKYRLAAGDTEGAEAALDAALACSRRVLTGIVEPTLNSAGLLVRTSPASSTPGTLDALPRSRRPD